jgi:hypothetical protein
MNREKGSKGDGGGRRKRKGTEPRAELVLADPTSPTFLLPVILSVDWSAPSMSLAH